MVAWAWARRLADRLGVLAHDLLTITRVVEAAEEDGTALDRVVSYVNKLGFDLGGRSVKAVVVAVALASGVARDQAVTS